MTSRVQQQRAEASNTPPAANSLLPGQLYVELADPMKLWAGTPTSLAPTQAKVLFDSTAYLKLTGGVMTGNLTLSNNPPAPQDAVPRSYVDSASGAAVPLTGGTMTGPLILSPGAPVQPQQAAPKSYVDTMVPLAGGTMTGLLTLSGPPTAPLGAVTKAYSDLKLPLAGGTMTGNLILNADPTVPLQAVTKQYIDNHPAVTVGDTPPASPNPGALWWDSVGAQMYVRYQDPNSTAWVIANQSTLNPTQAANLNASLNNTGRNFVTNGTFVVAQRGAGSWTTSGYTVDRWYGQTNTDTISFSVTSLVDADRTAIGNEAAQSGLQNTFTGNAAAAAYNRAFQGIEGVRRLSGKTVSVSFWAKAASGTPKLGVSIDQSFGTGGSPSAYLTGNGQSVTISTAWARYSVSVAVPSSAGKTFGTNGDDASYLLIWYSASTTNATPSGNVGVQSGTIQLWGVQLEIGTQPTALDPGGSPQQILAECQRFYCIGGGIMSGSSWGSGANLMAPNPFPVAMRAVPTVVVAATGGSGYSAIGAANQRQDSFTVQTTSNLAAGGGVQGNYTFTASADL